MGHKLNAKTKTVLGAAGFSSYTVLPTDEIILVDLTLGGPIFISLPDATTIPGKTYTVKKEVGAAGVGLILFPFAGQTVDSNPFPSLSQQGETITITSNGTADWQIDNLYRTNVLRLNGTLSSSTFQNITDGSLNTQFSMKTNALRFNTGTGRMDIKSAEAGDIPSVPAFVDNDAAIIRFDPPDDFAPESVANFGYFGFILDAIDSSLDDDPIQISVSAASGLGIAGPGRSLGIGKEVGNTEDTTGFLYTDAGEDADIRGFRFVDFRNSLVAALDPQRGTLPSGSVNVAQLWARPHASSAEQITIPAIVASSGSAHTGDLQHWEEDDGTTSRGTRTVLAKVDNEGNFEIKGLTENFRAVSIASDSITTDDSFLAVTAPGGGSTVTLPTAVGVTGRLYTVKAINGATNTTSIATTSSQTIDGAAAPIVLSTDNATVTLISDGANWLIKNQF